MQIMQKTAICSRYDAPVCYREAGSRLSTKMLRVMKLTVLFLAVALTAGARGVSQSVTLSGKNISLEKVFSSIRTQTGYRVFCDRALLNEAKNVSVSAQNVQLRSFLETVFKNQPLEYTIRSQTIFVSRKAGESPVNELPPVPIQGTITDGNGGVLYGATIKVKSSERSVVSDEKGKFLITVNTGDVLVISYVGFHSREIKVEGSAELTIVLERMPVLMEEVAVTVNNGYQAISKERSTGAYGVVTAKDLEEVPAVNIMQRLEGRVPGVRFDVRGSRIQIRSQNGYGENSEPLIVVDGFPLIETGSTQKLVNTSNVVSTMANGNILSSLNINDIEQITFLKDAVATSIWGSKGANGVIVIQTKRGKKGNTSINFSSTLGVSQPPSLSTLNWMNTAQYVDLERELVEKNFITDPTAVSWYSPLNTANSSEVQEWLFKVKRGTATQQEADAALAQISARDNSGQIRDYLLQTGISQQYNLSLSGGGDNNTYFVSTNFNKDVPIYKSNFAQNINVTANLTNDFFNKRVRLRTGFNYQAIRSQSNTTSTDALGLLNTSLRPYDMLVDEQGTPIQYHVFLRPEVALGLTNKGYLPFTYSAVDELNYGNTNARGHQIRLNAGVNVKITDWLDADVSGMYQRNMTDSRGITDAESYNGRKFINEGTTVNNLGRLVYNAPYGGIYRVSEVNNFDLNLRGLLNFNYNIGNDHSITAMAGTEVKEANTHGLAFTQYGFDPLTNSFATVNPTTPYMTLYGWTTTLGSNITGPSDNRTRFLSYFGNAAYTWKEKYNFSGSARFDDYTNIGLDRSKRARPFYSMGFKWSAAKEKFLNDVSWLNGLDARVTYGTGGTIPQGGYNKTVISVNQTDPLTLQQIATLQNPANQQLGWETTATFNTGLDIRAFNNRITASVDAYWKKSSGILATLPFNATYGWSSLSYNTGKLKSNGVELGLSGKVVNKKDWGITSTLNFAYSENTVTDSRYSTFIASQVAQGGSYIMDGYNLGSMFVYRNAGLDPTTGQTQIYNSKNEIIKHTTNLTSDFTIKDLKYVGVRAAPYHGGFNNSFRYKNMELGVQTAFYMGHVFLKPSINNYPNFSSFFGVLGKQEDLAYRWKTAGDEANTVVPGLTGVNNNSIIRYRYSDALVRKADNIRLQQISLAYRFSEKMLPRGIKGLSLSATARNLGMIWAANAEKLDPEFLNPNANYYSVPPVTSYYFNLNVSF